MKLILASSSYSRRKILKNLKIQFICIPPKINEDQKKLLYKDRGYNIKKTTYELAKSKSKSISKKHRKKCENQGFGPPKTLPKPSRNPFKIDVQ